MHMPEDRMAETPTPIRQYARIARGLLLILWGCTILFDFVPLGAGLVGTGLILFSANAVRLWNRLPPDAANTTLGVIALAWGGLELARPVLHQLLGTVDPDWAIFAILLIVLGLLVLAPEIIRAFRASAQGLHGKDS